MKKPHSPYEKGSFYDRLFSNILSQYCVDGITADVIDKQIAKNREIASDWLNQSIQARLNADHTIDTLKAIKAENF